MGAPDLSQVRLEKLPKGYRKLAPGEVIRAGDLRYWEVGPIYLEVTSSIGWEVRAGEKVYRKTLEVVK